MAKLTAATFSAASHTVVNIGEESRPRLVSCVKASQGFDWNQGNVATLILSLPNHVRVYGTEANVEANIEIFLPSYADFHFDTELETRRDPVAEIVLTEEEVRGMFPE